MQNARNLPAAFRARCLHAGRGASTHKVPRRLSVPCSPFAILCRPSPTSSDRKTCPCSATWRLLPDDVPWAHPDTSRAYRCGGLKRRCAASVYDSRSCEEDALSSAATPPPEADAVDASLWSPCKRACVPSVRRVRISSTSGVRYIKDLKRLAEDECNVATGNKVREEDPEDAGEPDEADGVETTKFIDGPSPEAVVVDQLVQAVTSTCDTTSVCPILKTMVQTGAQELLQRVQERLQNMDQRIQDRGKVSMLPSGSVLGPDTSGLLWFLRESAGRSTSLISAFHNSAASVYDDIDAKLELSPDQRNTAAAILALSRQQGQGLNNM